MLQIGAERLLVLRLPKQGLLAPAVLTPAERAVAELAVSGHSNAQIARARKTQLRTVANQLANVFRKLGVGSRSQLARVLVPR